jgi:hypothetical protein
LKIIEIENPKRAKATRKKLKAIVYMFRRSYACRRNKKRKEGKEPERLHEKVGVILRVGDLHARL